MADGKEIHLTRVEYKIVSMLAKNSGKVITYKAPDRADMGDLMRMTTTGS